MIELVHILRAIVEETAYGGVRGENLHQKKYAVPPIKLSELERRCSTCCGRKSA
jgi:hypothetical protein